ncbi:MAG: PIN domain-containing protein [Desulfobacterales bacterium]|nr:PIN domain-containing protein [Desulfobacterales bacterium]
MERISQSLVYLDTHIVCWLYEKRIEKLSQTAIDAIEEGNLFVSPMVDLEIQYLFEIGRISEPSDTVLSALSEDIGLQISTTPFSLIAVQARTLNWTRDPFDRLIVAEVLLKQNAQLITKDKNIREHFEKAVW